MRQIIAAEFSRFQPGAEMIIEFKSYDHYCFRNVSKYIHRYYLPWELHKVLQEPDMAALNNIINEQLGRGATEEAVRAELTSEPVFIHYNAQRFIKEIGHGLADRVYEALLKERCIKVCYRPRYEEGMKEYTELNPLGLVFVDSLIYLVASVGEHSTPLQFLLHRMEKVTLLEKPATVPAGFTLQGYIKSGEFSYPWGKETIRLKALFSRDAAAYLHETPLPGTISLTDVDDDDVELEAEVLDSWQLRWWLRGFGSLVEVQEPAELRAEFKEMAGELRGMYR
jgi:predicted DNA-binding transcriptional regulator YafY